MRSNRSSVYLSVAALAVMGGYCLVPIDRVDWVTVVTGPAYFAAMALAGVVAIRRRSAAPIAAAALVRVAIGLVVGALNLAAFRFLLDGWEMEVALVVLLTAVSVPLLWHRADAIPATPRLAVPVLALLAILGVAGAAVQAAQPKWDQIWTELNPPNGRRESALVLDALNLSPGMRVADLGAGGGYFTFRIAEAVGPEGTVTAYDTDFDMVSLIWARARWLGADNVRVQHLRGEGRRLTTEQFDRIVMVNVGALTTCPSPDADALLGRLAESLAPGGELVVYSDWVLEWPEHKCRSLTANEVIAAAEPILSAVRVEPAVFRSQEHKTGHLIVLQRPSAG